MKMKHSSSTVSREPKRKLIESVYRTLQADKFYCKRVNDAVRRSD